MRFDKAVKVIIKVEGGLVDNPNDPGGITKYGISLSRYPELGVPGIKNLTKKKAAELYKRDFWDHNRITSFPLKARLAIFDACIQHGRWAKLLQEAINTTPARGLVVDGIIGPKTMAAVKSLDTVYFLEKFMYRRQLYYRSLSRYDAFGEIWERRVNVINIIS